MCISNIQTTTMVGGLIITETQYINWQNINGKEHIYPLAKKVNCIFNYDKLYICYSLLLYYLSPLKYHLDTSAVVRIQLCSEEVIF